MDNKIAKPRFEIPIGRYFQSMRELNAQHDIEQLENMLANEVSKFNVDEVIKDKAEALYEAARRDHVPAVKLLLDNGVDANLSDQSGISCLHIAAKLGSAQMVVFLAARINVNAMNNEGQSPLHLAARYGQRDTVTALLDNKANVNATDKLGSTPLHVAVASEHRSIVQLLLDVGANVNLLDNSHQSAFELSLPWIDAELFDYFVEHKGSLRNHRHRTAAFEGNCLHCAMRFSKLEVIRKIVLLNEVRVNEVDRKNDTPLHLLLYRKRFSEKDVLEMVKLLVEQGACVNGANSSDETPLSIAVERGFLNVVEFLHEAGADIDGHDKNPTIFQACTTLDLAMVRLLLSRGVKVADVKDARGMGVLHFCVESIRTAARDKQLLANFAYNYKCVLLFDLLLAKGAPIDEKNARGQTPLQRAVEHKLKAIAEHLISKGANVNERDAYGNTLLSMAVKKRNKHLAKHLIDHGAHLKDESALLAVFECDQLDILDLLLSEGVRVEREKLANYLLTAIASSSYRAVNYLLGVLGADINCETDGSTALEYAYVKWTLTKSLISGRVMDALLCHIALFHAQRWRVSEKNWKLIECEPFTRECYQDCVGRVRRMEKLKLHESFSTTYCDFLMMRNNALVNRLRCKQISHRLLQTDARDQLHGSYADKLEIHLTSGLQLLERMQRFEKFLQDTLRSELPDVVIRKISEFYNDADFASLSKHLVTATFVQE